jgi:hypothetical protein
MKKILVGALVCAAVAGVVYYLRDPEGFSDSISDLKDKVGDSLRQALEGLKKSEPEGKEAVNKSIAAVKQVGERTHNSMHEIL